MAGASRSGGRYQMDPQIHFDTINEINKAIADLHKMSGTTHSENITFNKSKN